MKTREEILETWDTEGRYTDWYAIDCYNPLDASIKRQFVGTEDDVIDRWRTDYSYQHLEAMGNFYRMSIIPTSDALIYFLGKVDEPLNERGVYSITEAAGILGISRQRVHQLIEHAQLDAYKVGNTWNIYRYSVEKRLNK